MKKTTNQDNSAFLERRNRRLSEWRSELKKGMHHDDVHFSFDSAENNLKKLEILRGIVYPELADSRMNRDVAKRKD